MNTKTKPTLSLLTALLLFPSVPVRAQSLPKDAAGIGYPWLDGVPKINQMFHDNAKTFYRI